VSVVMRFWSVGDLRIGKIVSKSKVVYIGWARSRRVELMIESEVAEVLEHRRRMVICKRLTKAPDALGRNIAPLLQLKQTTTTWY
jgi:hypothetical protein